MAPPTNKPRLGLIDPQALGLDAERKLIDHLASMHDALGTAFKAPAAGRSPIFGEVRALAEYAKTGQQPVNVEFFAASICRLLAAPLSAGTPEDLYDRSIEDPLGLVVAAALARDALAHGRPIEAEQLAALSGLSERQIQEIVRAGAIQGARAVEARGRKLYAVEAKSARRWLCERGVPGFEKKARGRSAAGGESGR